MVSEWALIRRNELVDIPDQFVIHPDFLQTLSREEFESAFRDIRAMFYRMYSDMAESPQRFGLPLYKTDEYHYFSNQAREARTVSWNLFFLMLWLFAYGDLKENVFITDTEQVRKMNKAKKTNRLLEALCDYGFVFGGIKKYSLTSANKLEIEYPDNQNVIKVLSAVAKKVTDTQLKDVRNIGSGISVFSNAFIGWNYRVLAEDLHTCSLAEGCDYVSDKMHNEADREVIEILDQILMEQGCTRKKADSNEGPMIRYYAAKPTIHDYALNSEKGELYLELRIRNAEKCLNYLNKCPERIVEMFRRSDTGCQNRINGSCKFGVKYEFEKEEKWHCGCCGAPFKLHPIKEDIPHYLKLVELGGKR
ncbi:MAG: hypothetical protein K2O06_04145 [Acetatifactor sp.]|nr:hypothetical protein [Acetatifactor sp.]